MRCHGTAQHIPVRYVPPPLGNGELSIQIDMEGVQTQKKYVNMIPTILRAGRRYDTSRANLIPFGFITHDYSDPLQWEQELDMKRAVIKTDCKYETGQTLQTEAFVHLGHNLFAIRKKFTGTYTLRYHLSDSGNLRSFPSRMSCVTTETENGVNIIYKIAGLENLDGIISFWCDNNDAQTSIEHNVFSITVNGDEACFFLSFHDKLNSDDFILRNTELKSHVDLSGYDGLFSSHEKMWAEYWKQSYVKIPSQSEECTYLSAQYHLRISSTEWSIPLGIFNTHWVGKYSPFDDFFAFMGLVTSGHVEIAEKITNYRFALLDQAKRRAHHYHGESLSGAKYCWHSFENGLEAANPSFWLEHIFHMANIALAAWYFYKYTGKKEYLAEKSYPVISECAEYYRIQHIYQIGENKYILGKCTDLERLGAARENAFMSTCGVIATFEAAAQAAQLLDIDKDKAIKWLFLAQKLRESLPVEDGRYVPFPGCTQKSIAVFSGTYPYHILDKTDHFQKKAMDDYIANEAEYGNMYPIGNSVCAWYACWKGISFARIGDMTAARKCIEHCAGEPGCFSEIFEVSNPPLTPWFTTSEGAYINLINESLMQSTDNVITIIDCGLNDYSFRLAAFGGVMVDAEVKDGRVKKLVLFCSHDYNGTISLPDGRQFAVNLNNNKQELAL